MAARTLALIALVGCADEGTGRAPPADSDTTLTGLDTGTVARAPSLFVGAPALLGPVDPATPLVDVLRVETTEPTTLSLTVDDGVAPWVIEVDAPGTVHEVELLGLLADTRHTVTVAATAEETETWPEPLVRVTAPLPDRFPVVRVVRDEPGPVEPGVTFFGTSQRGGEPFAAIVAVDRTGAVRWYHVATEPILEVAYNRVGDLLYGVEHGMVAQLSLAGGHVAAWSADPRGLPGEHVVDVFDLHHDVHELADGSLLVLDTEFRVVEDFPSSEDDPDAPPRTGEVAGGVVVHLAPDGTVLERWSTFDFMDPLRIGRDSLQTHTLSDRHGTPARDWNHLNAVFHDTRDDTFVLSLRQQDAVVKLGRDGVVRWILAPPANWAEPWRSQLLELTGGAHHYHQHAAMITAAGTLMLFDNGNHRASAYEPRPPGPQYSRAVEYRIDEQAMTAEEVWSYQPDPPLFAISLGDADALPVTGNVLVTFGNLTDVDASARIVEVTHTDPAEVVWELVVRPQGPGLTGPAVYRAARVDLGPGLTRRPGSP